MVLLYFMSNIFRTFCFQVVEFIETEVNAALKPYETELEREARLCV